VGGAGFLGRWVVKRLLQDSHSVVILDNFSTGSRAAIKAFIGQPGLEEVVAGDVRDDDLVRKLFQRFNFDTCFFLASAAPDPADPRNTLLTEMAVLNVAERCRFSSTDWAGKRGPAFTTPALGQCTARATPASRSQRRRQWRWRTCSQGLSCRQR
jgi:uncharacterized protein YbjT (DUF2867 family)